MTGGKTNGGKGLGKGKGAAVMGSVSGCGIGKGKGKGAMPMSNNSGGRTSSATKAGLQFSVARMAKFMKQGRYADRIGGGAPVYAAAAMQYICSEVLELAGNKAQQEKKQRIKPRHVMLAIKEDVELNKLLGNADFAQCGVVPNIPVELKRGKAKNKCCADDQDEAMME